MNREKHHLPKLPRPSSCCQATRSRPGRKVAWPEHLMPNHTPVKAS